MVAINTSPVLSGGDYSTVYEGAATTTLTDFVFSSEQETIFVTNSGVRNLTVLASGKDYKITPNQTIRITENTASVQVKAESGIQPFKIEGRSPSGGLGIINTQLAEIENNPIKIALNDSERSIAIQTLTDSTGNDSFDWVTVLAGKIAAKYPGWNVQVRTWNDATQDYGVPNTLQLGNAGLRYLDCSTGTTTRKLGLAQSIYLSGVIDVRLKLSVADWTPSALKSFVGKSLGDPNRGWYCGIAASTGRPNFTFSTDGTGATLSTMTALAAPTVTDGAITWLRWVFTPNNGAGNRTFAAYQSSDGVTWTQLGTTITTAGAVTVFNNTNAPYELGGTASGIGDTTAKIYEVQIRNGLNGQIVAPVIPDLWEPYNASAAQFAGSPTLTIVNGSHPGATIAYLTDTERVKKLTPPFGQLITFLSASHNEGTTFGMSYWTLLDTLKNAALNNVPMASLIILTQNPETSGTSWYREHAKRRFDAIAYAKRNSYEWVDTYKAFLGVSNWETSLMADAVHPNATGGELWATAVFNKIFK